MRRLIKVKLTKDDKIAIDYEQMNGNSWDQYSFTCVEKALSSFYKALQDLASYTVEMCELPKDYLSRITVRGVSFSYGGEKEVMGATISARMKLNNSNCGLNLNTPHKASESYSDGPADEKQLLGTDCVTDLIDLRNECWNYVDGKRAQGKLELVV